MKPGNTGVSPRNVNEAGRLDGYLFASPTATYERIMAICDERGDCRAFLQGIDSKYTPAQRMFFALSGVLHVSDEEKRDLAAAEDFWNWVWGEPNPDVEYLAGFGAGVIAGCLDVEDYRIDATVPDAASDVGFSPPPSEESALAAQLADFHLTPQRSPQEVQELLAALGGGDARDSLQ